MPMRSENLSQKFPDLEKSTSEENAVSDINASPDDTSTLPELDELPMDSSQDTETGINPSPDQSDLPKIREAMVRAATRQDDWRDDAGHDGDGVNANVRFEHGRQDTTDQEFWKKKKAA